MQSDTDWAAPGYRGDDATDAYVGAAEAGMAAPTAGIGPTRARRALPAVDRRELAAIFLGGAAGALLRVWLGLTFMSSPGAWPWATFAINVSGSLTLGYLATRLQERPTRSPSPYRGPLLATGFCGTYTTFSTMQVEILRMLDHDRYGLAAAYATASVAAGYLAIWLARAMVRRAR